MAFPMRSKNLNPTFKSLNNKPSIAGFKMFKLNMRRKERVEEDYEPEVESTYSPSCNDTNNSDSTSVGGGSGGYVSIWGDSPVVKPLKNQLVPREARVTDTRIPNLKVLAQPPNSKGGIRDSTASSIISIHEEQQQQKENTTIEDKSRKSDVSITRTMEIGHRRVLEEMANYCSREPSDRKEWGYWFEAYTKGHYNMSHPPQTPPRKPSLSWIPTPFPADEPDRLRSLNRYDLSRASHIEADLRTVLRAAATALKAEFASISFVDYESETFILNHPIRIGTESKTKRALSLGAHVMLGNDSMVILDTDKDWRFKGNPTLQNGGNKINFYAGSPLISADGYNIGVLAISGRHPRSIFGKNDLRSLNNFAHVVSTHLERLLPESRKTLSLVEHQTSPSVDMGGRESTASAPAKMHMDEFSQSERRVRSAELNQKYNSLGRSKSPGPSRKVMAARLEAEKTLTKAGRGGRQYNYHQAGLPVLPSLPIPPATIDILPPRPPPTPPPSATTPTYKLGSKKFKSGAQTPTTPPISPASFPPSSPNPPPTPPLPLNLPLSTFQPAQKLPEARAILSDIAQAIDFDYLYIIRLDPTSSNLTYPDLLSPSSFQVVMVRSYRRNPGPPGSANQALNTELHLKALGDRCGLTAVNSRESGRGDDDSYQVSALLPLQRDYVDERGSMVVGPVCGDGAWSRRSGELGVRVCRGHILGAFKRRNTGNHNEAIERLRTVASQLGELMFEAKA
ncbi:hypothetical protein TWF481_007417 [Arthrobotrys musiformis]|uniref:GAF domain-containing protein n=1 Tax=Arthrobotrys musiformis TaxID=47236 RepID=A0AAV9WBK9_9PEZI